MKPSNRLRRQITSPSRDRAATATASDPVCTSFVSLLREFAVYTEELSLFDRVTAGMVLSRIRRAVNIWILTHREPGGRITQL